MDLGRFSTRLRNKREKAAQIIKLRHVFLLLLVSLSNFVEIDYPLTALRPVEIWGLQDQLARWIMDQVVDPENGQYCII